VEKFARETSEHAFLFVLFIYNTSKQGSSHQFNGLVDQMMACRGVQIPGPATDFRTVETNILVGTYLLTYLLTHSRVQSPS